MKIQANNLSREELVDVIRQAALDGKTFGEVAKETGRSRNSISGLASRNRISFALKSKSPKRAKHTHTNPSAKKNPFVIRTGLVSPERDAEIKKDQGVRIDRTLSVD